MQDSYRIIYLPHPCDRINRMGLNIREMRSIHNKRYKAIIAFIRGRRMAAGITQKEMAKKIHLRQNVISKIETCERRMDLLEMLSYCKAINVSLDEVVRQLEAT